jgi:hypothetical protein
VAYVYDFAGTVASDSTPSVTVDTTVTGTGALVARRLDTKVVSLQAAVLIDPGSGQGTSSNPAPQRRSAGVRAVTCGMPNETTTAHATRYALDRFLAPVQIEQDSLADTTFLERDANGYVTSALERRKQKTVASSRATFSGPRLLTATDALAAPPQHRCANWHFRGNEASAAHREDCGLGRGAPRGIDEVVSRQSPLSRKSCALPQAEAASCRCQLVQAVGD